MRLLLVDDDEALMETLAERLVKQRYAVDIATSGEMAQEFLALFDYDLLVECELTADLGVGCGPRLEYAGGGNAYRGNDGFALVADRLLSAQGIIGAGALA